MLFSLRSVMVVCVVSWSVVSAQDSSADGGAPSDLAARTAELYERSHATLLAAFDLDEDYQNSYLPTELGVPCHEWRFSAEVWGEAVEKSAPARELFAQAAALPAPRFEELLAMGLAELDEVDLCPRLGEVMQVVAAHGDLVRSEQPRQALNDAYTLLRFSRHLVGHGRTEGIWIGRNAEQLGIRILRDTLVDDCSERTSPAILERCATELDRHRSERANLATVGGYLLAELPKTVPGPGPAVEGEPRPPAELAKTRDDRARALAVLKQLIEPLTADPPPTPESYREHLEPHRARIARLQAWAPSHPEYRMLAGFCFLVDQALPPVDSFVEEEARFRQWCDEAGARLAELRRAR